MIALDIGASKLAVGEFSVSKSGGAELTNYGVGELGSAAGDTDTSAFIVQTLRQVMRANGIRPGPLYMSISGQTVFPRFVKLPPVAKDKIHQIVRYEAEQNVPFPIEEVVWDYQLLGDAEAHDEVNVMLVAVKTDNVSKLTDCVVAAGLEPDLVDVAPMALYNAVRYNYPDLQGGTLVLDIGARSSNLIFLEEERIFTRSIPVAGNSITQEIVKELGVEFEDAEKLKREHAFVAFGGVYAGPENETADRISKVVRNVVTRLHAEVNRSINFYRSQQGGSPPSLVLLTGGSSTIPHMDTFFREKLKVDVEFLNPFANIPVSGKIDTAQIEGDLHLLGEIVGLAIRRSLACPVEINLMPPELQARKAFRQRQPFFAVAAVGLVLIMFCWWVYFNKMRSVWEDRTQKLDQRLELREGIARELRTTGNAQAQASSKHATVVELIERRGQWLTWIEAVHEAMLEGMWIRSLVPTEKGGKTVIVLTGRGFDDLLKLHDTDTATAVELFRNRLRESEYFTSETSIDKLPPLARGAYARDFTLSIHVGKEASGEEASE